MTTPPAKPTWTSVTRNDPCPVCGHGSYCRVGKKVIHCMRVESTRPGKTRGWYHDRDDVPPDVLKTPIAKPPKKTDAELDKRFRPQAVSFFRRGKEKRAELAELLGVSVQSLTVLGVGWSGESWTVPERNGTGLVTGISTRAVDGAKQMVTGSRRGLVYPSAILHQREGDVLIVEGMSDVAAALTLKRMAIGRPSNVCGAELLAKLLRGWPSRIIVMGENDRREPKMPAGMTHAARCDGCQFCHPGLWGMRVVARELGKRLRRSLVVRLPPAGHKDLRSLLTSGAETGGAVRKAAMGLLESLGI